MKTKPKTMAQKMSRVPKLKKPLTAQAKRRVQLAKDVLMQLEAKKMKASPGTFCHIAGVSKMKASTQLQKVLQAKPCEVCAKGALFVADVLRHNDFTVHDGGFDDSSMVNHISVSALHDRLNETFPETMADDIESAFESNGYFDWNGWHRAFPTAPRRMAAIMRNIVRNRGAFRIEDVR
jgi:hypothetical protein